MTFDLSSFNNISHNIETQKHTMTRYLGEFCGNRWNSTSLDSLNPSPPQLANTKNSLAERQKPKGYLQVTTENMEGNWLQRLNILKTDHILI